MILQEYVDILLQRKSYEVSKNRKVLQNGIILFKLNSVKLNSVKIICITLFFSAYHLHKLLNTTSILANFEQKS